MFPTLPKCFPALLTVFSNYVTFLRGTHWSVTGFQPMERSQLLVLGGHIKLRVKGSSEILSILVKVQTSFAMSVLSFH